MLLKPEEDYDNCDKRFRGLSETQKLNLFETLIHLSGNLLIDHDQISLNFIKEGIDLSLDLIQKSLKNNFKVDTW